VGSLVRPLWSHPAADCRVGQRRCHQQSRFGLLLVCPVWVWAYRGARTNLKVVGHRSKARVGGGRAPIRRKAPEKFFGRAPPLFGSKSTIHRFGERFRDGQYSLVSFLFAVFPLTVPRAQSFVKLGGGGARAPRAPWSRRTVCVCATSLSVCACIVCCLSLYLSSQMETVQI